MRPRTERSQTHTGCNCAKGRFQIFDGIFYSQAIISRGENDCFEGRK